MLAKSDVPVRRYPGSLKCPFLALLRNDWFLRKLAFTDWHIVEALSFLLNTRFYEVVHETAPIDAPQS